MILYPVHVACNYPDNGAFAYRADALALDFGGIHLDLAMVAARAPGFLDLKSKPNTIRLGRCEYGYKRSTQWVGNWCWNAYWMTEMQALRLVQQLLRRDHRFSCEGGPVEACEAWESREPLAVMGAWKKSLERYHGLERG